MAHARDEQGKKGMPAANPPRSRPPAIDVEAIAKTSSVEATRDRSYYASPSRSILDTIGSPRTIQRVSATVLPTDTTPPRGYGSGGGGDHQIHTVEDIGRRVRERRNAMSMTQQRFADLAGVGRRFLIELENGKPGLEIGRVLKVCKAAGIRLGFLA